MCIYIINCENTYSYVKCTVHDSPVMDKHKHSHKGTKYNLYSGRANMHISECIAENSKLTLNDKK